MTVTNDFNINLFNESEITVKYSEIVKHDLTQHIEKLSSHISSDPIKLTLQNS